MSDTNGNGADGAAPDSASKNPVIVTVGASAGGVAALQRFFDEVPDDTGAAFVVVVHLDPEHRSELPQILAGRTRMPVAQVNAAEKLQADHVYVIPPDRRVQLIDHTISSAEFDEPRGRRAPIDLFFRSAAERVGDGFAVVLSGAGSDGAIGVRAVKEAGGIILVQDPQEAEYSSMPRAAIASGVADFILPVRELAMRLVELIRLKQTSSQTQEPEIDEEQLRRVLAHLRVRTGHDFSKYKRSTVLRRIARRMQVTRTDNLREYYEAIRDNVDEAQALLGDLLISVTTFFRDQDAYESLRNHVLPKLFADRDPSATIRVWVSGCATGEEAYSIAMLLLEEAAKHEFHAPIQMFGSDLDARALAVAREGRYPASIEADVNEDRLRRFFVREGEGYRVRQELRDVILFALHDLLKDPPFSHVDFISCRNVLIYLDRDLQDQVCSTFHYALNPGGYLLLGASETADSPPGLFRNIDRTARIYKSIPQSGDKPRLLPRLLGPITVRDQTAIAPRHVSPSVALSEAALHRRVLEKVAPPSILVDDMHRIIHLSENAGRFVMPSAGSLSADVVDLVRPELRFELRSALHRFFEQRQSTLSLPIMVRFNGTPHRVHIQVTGISEGSEPPQALVMFIEGEAIDETMVSTESQANDEVVRRLRQELELTQSRLRTVREESDAANEELRAANEELQSINEEYRSTSEELETSKEELQSINEELQTVNSELKLKLEAISRAHSDLQNLLAAADFGTLFLDSNLRIKRFTERATELFSITPSDEGRPISDFSHQLAYDDLIQDARKVLSDLMPIRREIRSRNDFWYDMRMRPYRTVDNKIDGVVITFVDITERRHTEEALRESARQLGQQKRLVELARAPIMVWEFGGGLLEWNRGCEELYGYTREEAIGQRKEDLLKTRAPGISYRDVMNRLREEGLWAGELMQQTKDGQFLTVEAVMQLETVDGRQLALQSVRDVTERKAWEENQRALLKQLHQQKRLVELSRAPIFVWELDGGIIEWNRGCEQLYGYSHEEALGRRKHELLRTEVPGSSFAALVDELRAAGIWSGELRHNTKDGRILTVEAQLELETVDDRKLVLESTRDISDRKVWDERQRMLYRELAHRLKNTLTVVQSIAHQTKRAHPTLEEFLGSFDGRLAALGNVHALLSESNWESADLADLIRQLLAPYATQGADRYRIEGEPVALSADLMIPFGLVLHELATNASKYGAFSRTGGTVLIKWSVTSRNGRRTLEFSWEEHDGPPAPAPAPPSLGSALIEHAIPNAVVNREFRAEGLRCTISVPF
jgi:two-component system, chemotaxis family, CheB/CheR fusion protein